MDSLEAVRSLVREILSEERILDVDGKPAHILKNPSPNVAARMLMNSKEGFARYYAHGDGNIHMWSGDYGYGHHDFMEDHGIEHTPDNYAGAGTLNSVRDAHQVASAHAELRRRKPGK
jgi:hypothetical protein